jgi:hypothetical protein
MICMMFLSAALVFAQPPSEPHNANSMWIEPSSLSFSTASTNVGTRFNVTLYANITHTTGVDGIGGWQFKMSYDSSQLNATRALYKSGKTSGQSQFFENITVKTLTPTLKPGSVTFGESWAGDPTTGPFAFPPIMGGLAIVEFNITAAPPPGGKLTSVLDISTGWASGDTFVVDYDSTLDVLDNVYNANYEYISSAPAAPLAYLAIEPSSGSYGPSNVLGVQFDEKISIKSLSASSNIVNASLKLHYDHTPNILATRAVTFDTAWNVTASFDNSTYGVLSLYVQTNAISPPLSGNVSVATVKFEITYQGNYPETNIVALTFSDTALKNSTAQIQTAAAITGSITVLGYQAGIHDIAIVDVSPARSWVYRGNLISINVTAQNLGSVTEPSFNITAYCDNFLIGNISITNLAANTNVTSTFVWNTTSFSAFHNYTISSEAIGLPADINTTNNKMADGTVDLRIMGDTNGDGSVTIMDILAAAGAFGSRPPPGANSNRWNPQADINGDNKVDIIDLFIVAKNFGKMAPP